MTQLDDQTSSHSAGEKPSFLPVLLGISCAFFFGVIFVQAFREATGTPLEADSFGVQIAGLLGTWTGFGVGIAWAAGFSWSGLRNRLGLRFKKTDLPLGLLIGVLSQFVLVTLIYLPIQIFAPGVYDDLGDPAREQADLATGANYIFFALAVGLGSPLMEELLFRGVLLRAALARWTVPLSVFVSGFVFAVIHFQAVQTLALFGFGVVLAILAHRTGRLGLSIWAHAGFNLTTVTVLALS